MNNSAKRFTFFAETTIPGIYYRLRGPFLTVLSSKNHKVVRFEALVFWYKNRGTMIGLFGVPLYKFIPFIIVLGVLQGVEIKRLLTIVCILLPVSLFANLVATLITEGDAKEQVICWIDKYLTDK